MSNKTLRFDEESSSDIITRLPGDLIECILNNLPIEDAVRTSVLSNTWKRQWVSLPNLIFSFKDMDCCFRFHPSQFADELAKIVNKILSQHVGPIFTFELESFSVMNSMCIDQWILRLSENGIKRFSLCFRIKYTEWYLTHSQREQYLLDFRTELNLLSSQQELYLLNSQLFAVQSLRVLKLSGVRIQFAPKFEGFSRLHGLKLMDVAMEKDVFECILAKCPLLTCLGLGNVQGLDSLNVLHPKLKRIFFVGGLQNLCLNSEKLVDSSIFVKKHFPIAENLDQEKRYADFRLWLSRTRVLRGCGNLLEFLGFGSVHKNGHFTFVKLRTLKLYNVSFNQLDNVSCLLRLIRSSPNLEELLIKADSRSSGSIEPVMEYNEREDYEFLKLKVLEMETISATEPVMGFIKFIVAKSPNLLTLTVEPQENCELEDVDLISNFLTRLRPTSEHANVELMTEKYESRKLRLENFMR